jgi:hypothetical protein
MTTPAVSRRERLIVGGLLLAASLFIFVKAVATPEGVGRVYVQPSRMSDSGEVLSYRKAGPSAPQAVFSPARTIGMWIAALLTLCIFSYLYRDNPAYKLAESIVVGVSAAWTLVVEFWDNLVAKPLVKLWPDGMRNWAVPTVPESAQTDWLALVPLVLGILLFARFVPRGGWLARWPLAFVVGTFAGLRLVSYLDADFVSQIRSTIVPFVVLTNGTWDVWASLQNLGLVLCTLVCLTYFFFSVEHRGWIGRVARLGVWVLMITFGASFAFTVMGRITLLTMRFEFLFLDWLRL